MDRIKGQDDESDGIKKLNRLSKFIGFTITWSKDVISCLFAVVMFFLENHIFFLLFHSIAL